NAITTGTSWGSMRLYVEPDSQVSALARFHGSVLTITITVNAASPACTAIPISTSRSELNPPFHAMPYTIANATNAPAEPSPETAHTPAAGTKLITKIAPRPAPDVIPIMPGSASGFRQTAWIVVPATANAAPAR